MNTQLKSIAQKVKDQVRLSKEDGMTLLTTKDIWTVCELAHQVRLRKHGLKTYYNVNRHVNYSNVCALSCKFCEFFRKRGQDGAYEMSLDDVVKTAQEASDAGATELHIVGGLHPFLPFSYYTDMLTTLKEKFPHLHLKAFTAVEIVHLARISKRGKDIAGILKSLKEAGLDSLPGGGAEVFDDRIHDQAFKGKIRGDKWLEVHHEAHKLGLKTNATMLYGHIESLEDRIKHFCLLREEQDYAIENNLEGRFQTIIPLPFFPDGSELEHLPGPSGLDNLRMLAVSRLMLDNFEHVKVFWPMQTLDLAELSLQSGVNDMDGTVVWYDITKVGGASTHQETTTQDLRNVISQAGFKPIERDTLYNAIKRDGAKWEILETVKA